MYEIFDFCCPSCECVDERYIKDGDVQKCKQCGTNMNRLVSAPGMVKGNFADKPGFRGNKNVRSS